MLARKTCCLIGRGHHPLQGFCELDGCLWSVSFAAMQQLQVTHSFTGSGSLFLATPAPSCSIIWYFEDLMNFSVYSWKQDSRLADNLLPKQALTLIPQLVLMWSLTYKCIWTRCDAHLGSLQPVHSTETPTPFISSLSLSNHASRRAPAPSAAVILSLRPLVCLRAHLHVSRSALAWGVLSMSAR